MTFESDNDDDQFVDHPYPIFPGELVTVSACAERESYVREKLSAGPNVGIDTSVDEFVNPPSDGTAATGPPDPDPDADPPPGATATELSAGTAWFDPPYTIDAATAPPGADNPVDANIASGLNRSPRG